MRLVGSPCFEEEAKSRFEGSQSSDGADEMPSAPPLAPSSSTLDCWSSLRVPMTQAYAWLGLADIFLRLVLRLPGLEGEVEMRVVKAAWREGLLVQKELKIIDKREPMSSDISLFHILWLTEGPSTVPCGTCYLLRTHLINQLIQVNIQQFLPR